MKLGLGIIAKDGSEVGDKIKSYYDKFDSVIILTDTPSDGCKLYEWSDKEKESGRLDFARKRNYLHKLMCDDKVEYYLTIDTDDIVDGIDKVRDIADKANDSKSDIVYFPYHYSKDEFGNINAIHNKERLIRCSNNMYWKMPIHENMVPIDGYQQKLIFSDIVTVIHDVDHNHSEDSFDRNMVYFIEEWNEKKEDTDPRTIAYLGRCCMAKQDFKKAIYFLRLHVDKSGWDEDKCMSLCQLSDAYRQLKDYEVAIKFAFMAMSERHDFPDPYLKLHDAYMEKQDYERAIYWGEIGAKMKAPDTFMITDPSYYTWRIALSLAFCYMQVDNVDNAYKLFSYAKKCAPGLDFIKNNDRWFTKAYEDKKFFEKFLYVFNYVEENCKDKLPALIESIPDDMRDNDIALRIRNKYGEPKEWDSNSIVIICGETLDQWSPKSVASGIGGSEEAVIYLSESLTRQGYKVTVYNGCGDDGGNYNGVEYCHYTKLNPNDNFNILIGWRNNIFKMYSFRAHYKYIWLHDVYQNGTCEDHSQYDGIIVLSEFHKSLLPECIPDDKIIVSANGIPNIDKCSTIERVKNRLIYASSYDRGLEHLLRRWNEVKTAVPDAELHIYYGWNNYEKLVNEGHIDGKFMEEMNELMEQEGVFEHGRIGHAELHKEFQRAEYWVYPCHFNEISCITAMKAQALGCTPVVTNHAALAETVKSGVIVAGDASNNEVMDEYVSKLISVLNGKYEPFTCEYDFSWDKVASQWKQEFDKRLWNPHDFKSMEQYKEVYSNMSENNVTLVDKNIITHRYKYALDVMVQNGCDSMLDIGTFDGALSVYASRIGIESTGIDINTTFIEAGKALIEDNPCTLIGGMPFEEFETDKKFDCVVATEVIEHVIDVEAFVKKIHGLLNDGGIFIVSTPYRLGKFGVTDHNPHHIRHYDKKMLNDDLGKYFDMKDYVVEVELINCYGVKKCLA